MQISLPLNTKIKCTEAKDNHVEHRELGEFMDFCEQYIIGDNGILVDMFLGELSNEFILDTDEKGNDKYVLGEINCSCVGFTSHLELADEVASNIINIASKTKA
ncbi:Uncharacterised protein [Campylobacter jejuni subsp. doylei]|nr:Uncharacterised protein [Campylobacter jejuni subsp. doylei]